MAEKQKDPNGFNVRFDPKDPGFDNARTLARYMQEHMEVQSPSNKQVVSLALSRTVARLQDNPRSLLHDLEKEVPADDAVRPATPAPGISRQGTGPGGEA